MKTLACTALFAGLLAAGPGGAFAQEAQRPPRTDMGQQQSDPGQQQRDFDLRFLDMTAMHHEMGLKMAQLAQQKAENEELKAKATEMTQAQREEIQQLDQLRARLYPDAPKREPMGGMMAGKGEKGSMPGHATSGEKGAGHEHAGQPQGTAGMDPGRTGGDMMGQMNRLEKLDGAEFDRAFTEMMIRHHQMNVRMAERAVEEAKHDEVRELARETSERQKKDIADLQKFTGSPK